MNELIERTKAMGELLKLETEHNDHYALSLGEMYLLSDGIRHLIESLEESHRAEARANFQRDELAEALRELVAVTNPLIQIESIELHRIRVRAEKLLERVEG